MSIPHDPEVLIRWLGLAVLVGQTFTVLDPSTPDTGDDPMSIQSFPIAASLATKVKKVLSKQAKDSDFEIVPVQGTPDLCYIREIKADGSTVMHGRETPRHRQTMRAYQARMASAQAQKGGLNA